MLCQTGCQLAVLDLSGACCIPLRSNISVHTCTSHTLSGLACSIWTAQNGRSCVPSPQCLCIWWQAQLATDLGVMSRVLILKGFK